ncbi:MAG TPA: SpoIID/LytB domain-containing protein [Actinomycetota bacterium]|nr:SpoIID/LytB domain-containing protein [Actinomycetota bacterium]
MRFRVPARASACALVCLALLSSCTSAPAEPGTRSSPPTPSPAPSREPETPSPTSADGALELSAPRVSIRAPRGGSFRVRGAYPWTSSRCVDAERPTLDGDYPGTLAVRTADDGTLTATVTISFRQYLEGIAEVPPSWPRAALEAQVVAARSYVLARTGWSGQQGESLDTPICGTADCQVYGGIPHPTPPGMARWYRAVRETRGQVLLFGGRPADTVYYSTSNGRTYGNDEVFGSSPLPYLRPVTERHDGASPLSRWQVDLPLDDLTTVLRAAGEWPGTTAIASAAVHGSTVRLKGGGRTGTIDTGTLRDAVNTWAPCLLPGRYPSDGLPVTIPSGWLDVAAGPRGLVVTGRGWGHGVGMVQWGAYGKARQGWTASQILAFYYGGLTPKRFSEPGTMQVVIATGLRSMIVQPTAAGAVIGGRALGRRPLRIQGGEAVTVSSSSG